MNRVFDSTMADAIEANAVAAFGAVSGAFNDSPAHGALFALGALPVARACKYLFTNKDKVEAVERISYFVFGYLASVMLFTVLEEQVHQSSHPKILNEVKLSAFCLVSVCLMRTLYLASQYGETSHK